MKIRITKQEAIENYNLIKPKKRYVLVNSQYHKINWFDKDKVYFWAINLKGYPFMIPITHKTRFYKDANRNRK